MDSTLIQSLCKPPVYTKTKVEFWNDEYISMQMLKAHLDPNFDGASRKQDFIEKSAAWIKEIVPPSEYPTLLDIGCGPGLYAERFDQFGYQVTGVDFSKRSIEYATQSAANKKQKISYLYQNYLEMDLNRQYDFATMIYCDYGALSTADRQLLLSKAAKHLKPGGKFLFDVFSMVKYTNTPEEQTWEVCPNGGFWRGDEYLALNGSYKYLDHVTLSQTLVLTKDQVIPYYIWDTYYTKESLIQEVESAGFTVCGLYGDIAGSPYCEDSETMAILVERK